MKRIDVKAFSDRTESAAECIDCHFHVFRRPQVAQPGARYTPSYAASLADWEAAAPTGGSRRGVLVQTSFAGTDNGELLEALRSRPQTLRGVAVIDPPTATAGMLAALDADGVRGIRLNLVGATPQALLAAAALPPRLADELVALGWNVELHTDAGRLPQVLERIDPRLPVVLDHFGKPTAADAGDATFGAVARRLASGGAPMHVKLSAPYRLGGLDPRTPRRAVARDRRAAAAALGQRLAVH